MKTIRTLCQFVAVILAIAVLTPLLMVYIAGEYIVGWCSLAHETWVQCRKLTALLALCAVSAGASEVTLAWDKSPNTNATTFLYGTTNATLVFTNRGLAQVKIDAKTNSQVLLTELMPGKWRFAATARLNNVESDFSNQVMFEVLPAPANLRTLTILYAATLDELGTNAASAFMKIKLGP